MTFIHVLLGPFYTSLLCFHWSPTILNIVFYMSLCICILYVEINEMKNEMNRQIDDRSIGSLHIFIKRLLSV